MARNEVDKVAAIRSSGVYQLTDEERKKGKEKSGRNGEAGNNWMARW